MNQTVFQCTKCQGLHARKSILQDVCPTCGGEIVDVTHTRAGRKFLNNTAIPTELRHSPLDGQNVYATGPSNLFSVNVGEQA